MRLFSTRHIFILLAIIGENCTVAHTFYCDLMNIGDESTNQFGELNGDELSDISTLEGFIVTVRIKLNLGKHSWAINKHRQLIDTCFDVNCMHY